MKELTNFGEVLTQVDLKKYNTYGLGGTAAYLVKPNDLTKLIDLIKYLKEHKMSYYLLGSGSNVILPDNNFAGVIIKLEHLNKISFAADTAIVEAGATMASFVQDCLKHEIVNFSFAAGIPGTIGAALVGNVGCFGHEIYDYVVDVIILDENDEVKTLPKAAITHGYRSTEFKNRSVVILSATLKAMKGSIEAAQKQIKENNCKRQATQPLGTKNAGSVFRNPPGVSAGKLIEEANFKGFKIGDAMVSPKHANFIINTQKASSRDIIELITKIKKTIKEKNNIDLELEQIIVKW